MYSTELQSGTTTAPSWSIIRRNPTVSVGLLGRESEVATGQRWAQSIERNKAVPDVGAYDEHQRGREGNRYHPMVGAVAGSHDVVHSRQRGGNATRTGERPASSPRASTGCARRAPRVRSRCGPTRASTTTRSSTPYRSADARYSITVKLSKGLRKLIEAIDESAWTPIPYFFDGADVAETTYKPFGAKGRPCRFVVRRVRPTPGSQLALFTEFSYHAFITDHPGATLELEADHRGHAEIENVIRDLKYGVGLNHFPSGRFGANAAWLGLNVIDHNLARFSTRLSGSTVK